MAKPKEKALARMKHLYKDADTKSMRRNYEKKSGERLRSVHGSGQFKNHYK